MKINFFLIVIIASCIQITDAQESNSPWQKWSWLIGEWVGDGNGSLGQRTGGFSLREDLGGKILVRKAHSEYPAQEDKPGIKHDDLMIVHAGEDSLSAEATYYDNEGHIINYSVSFAESSIVFLSDKMPKSPIFRLTYRLLGTDDINVLFEMSQDGEHFMKYVEGKCHKKKG